MTTDADNKEQPKSGGGTALKAGISLDDTLGIVVNTISLSDEDRVEPCA